jgi:uncharacterized protein (DUF1501 family)
MTSRRDFLTLLGLGVGASTLALWPDLSQASGGADTRLLVLMLRGGLDGLHAVPPYGDRGYAALRGPLALSIDGSRAAGGAALKLDANFALHPALGFFANLYARGQCLPIVAAAPPYWGRSHFEAQDCVENGTATPGGAETGWLNRVVGVLHGDALTVSAVMPLIMRGPAKIDSWSPPLALQVDPILLQRLEPLYGEDPRLAAAFADAIARQPVDAAIDQAMGAGSTSMAGAAAGMAGAAAGMAGVAAAATGPGMAGIRHGGGTGLPELLRAAGTFMARPAGPRIGFVESYGWDTHANQAAILNGKLAELDAGVTAFHEAVAAVWNRSVVVIVTEFGRTARINGTNGTDHGTGGAMFLLGGAVRGGRVGGEWPGLAPARLYQDRDVLATTDQRAIFKGLLAEHLGIDERALDGTVFPGSAAVRPAAGLVSPAAASG